MAYRTIIFDEVKIKGSCKTFCRKCKKPRTKSFTCSQTINPFNKSEVTGNPKTRNEIVSELAHERERYINDLHKNGVICRACGG